MDSGSGENAKKESEYIKVAVALVLVVLVVLGLVCYQDWEKEQYAYRVQVMHECAPKGELVFADDNGAPPISFVDHDGVYKGIMKDYMNEMAIELGVDIVEKPCDFDDALLALQNNQSDFCSMMINDERKEYLVFSDPIYTLRSVLVQKKSTNYQLKDLNGLRVATQQGDFANDYMKKQYPGAKLVYVSNIREALGLLTLGNVDMVVGDEPVISYYIEQSGLNESMYILGKALYEGQVCLGMPREKAAMVPYVNQAIANIKVKGQLQKIQQKWFGLSTPLMEDKSKEHAMEGFVMAGMVILVLFVLIHMYSLQKQVKLRTKDLEKALELAKKADQAKTAFLFNMSHDIRTPMNAILGYTDLLKDNLGNVEKSADYLAKIKESGDFLLTLINNVLEMARIESGHMTLDEVPCSLADIFASIGNIYAEMFRGKKIKVAKNLQFHSKYVYCDKLKITEIFVNLVSNALKYTPEGGTISVDVEEIPCDREGYTTIRAVIADTGIGMSEEFQQVLFEVFTRERNSAGNRIEGTGLGMPIVKKLVTLMGGTIEVKSKLGEGSAFTITISHRIAEDVVMEDKKETSQDLKVLQGRRILLAEDNDLNAEIAMEILKKYGLQVERAEDGAICVEMLKQHEDEYYDLILMDVQMPNMDGYTACRTIRELKDTAKSSIPVIAMTANAFAEDRENALAAGMNEHIAKPLDVEKILEILIKFLEKQ